MRIRKMMMKLFYKLAPEFKVAKDQTEDHRVRVERAERTQSDMRHSVDEALQRVKR